MVFQMTRKLCMFSYRDQKLIWRINVILTPSILEESRCSHDTWYSALLKRYIFRINLTTLKMDVFSKSHHMVFGLICWSFKFYLCVAVFIAIHVVITVPAMRILMELVILAVRPDQQGVFGLVTRIHPVTPTMPFLVIYRTVFINSHVASGVKYLTTAWIVWF